MQCTVPQRVERKSPLGCRHRPRQYPPLAQRPRRRSATIDEILLRAIAAEIRRARTLLILRDQSKGRMEVTK